MKSEPSVTACIPYYGGKRYIRRAVESLLRQTYRDIQVIVVNDGDPNPPWDELASLNDPRLIRFNLTCNHGGPFFANEVVVEAVASPWLLIQEQDDWSTPDRVEQLLRLAVAKGAHAAVSAQYFHRQRPDGTSAPIGIRWKYVGRSVCPACPPRKRCQRCFVDTGLTGEYRHRAPHTGLLRLELLRELGGYYAGLRLHYDSLLMNLLLMTGTVAHTPLPLYHRLFRPDSITQAKSTGFGSRASNRECRMAAELYRKAFGQYQRYVSGLLSSRGLTESIRHYCQANLATRDRQELAFEAQRLRSWIAAQRSRRHR